MQRDFDVVYEFIFFGWNRSPFEISYCHESYSSLSQNTWNIQIHHFQYKEIANSLKECRLQNAIDYTNPLTLIKLFTS